MITASTYNELIRKSYDYDQDQQDNSLGWHVVRALYERNYIGSVCKSGVSIPKKIHQIWLGRNPSTEFANFMTSWKQVNPDWEYKLWMDRDLDNVKIPNRRLFNSIEHIAQKSDFLRYHILNQFGGLYVDTDFECLKPFDDLCYLGFYTGIGYPKELELYIGLIASVPHHPILEHIISKMTVIKYGGQWRNIFHTTGSFFFTRMFLEMVNEETKGVVAFPMDYFYPYPNNVRKVENIDPYAYATENSYAIHHWAGSWNRKRKVHV